MVMGEWFIEQSELHILTTLMHSECLFLGLFHDFYALQMHIRLRNVEWSGNYI
jgi:hypothetical protein